MGMSKHYTGSCIFFPLCYSNFYLCRDILDQNTNYAAEREFACAIRQNAPRAAGENTRLECTGRAAIAAICRVMPNSFAQNKKPSGCMV